MVVRVLSFLALAAFLPLPGVWSFGPASLAAQLAPDTAARIDSLFEDLNRSDGPGCALGVIRDGRLAYGKGHGSSNLDYRRPITPETNFYTASVSKHVVAAAVLVAEKKGLLSLDDPVRKWLPDLPEYDGPTLTLRHLIHHTSGLRDRPELTELATWRFRFARETEDYLDLIYRQQGLNFEPGSEHGYSNTNYLLLAEIVGEAAGSSLREFADEHLFEPLGMHDTHFHDDRTHVIRNRAVGYARDEHGYRMIHNWKWDQVGSGGWYTNIEDLARWDRNFETEAVGGDGFTDRMTTRGVLADGDTISYAFGLLIDEHRGQRTAWHNGVHAGGFRTHYRRFPEAGLSTVVLCNFISADPEARADSVAAIVLADQLAPTEEPRQKGDGTAPAGKLSSEDLEPYTGTYRRAEDRLYVRFVVDEGQLVAKFFGDSTPLRPIAPGRFAMVGAPVEWTFGEEDGGRSEEAEWHTPVDTSTFRRVELAAYTADERATFQGRYHSDELAVDYRVLATGDSLQLVQGHREPKLLRPGIQDEFRFGDGVIRFTRSERGRVTGFTVNTGGAGGAQGVRFERRP